MSWNKHLKLIAIVSLAATIGMPALAHAQRRGGNGGSRGGGARSGGGSRVVVSRPVVIAPFSPFSPFYSRYYNPFFFDFYGWGYPGFYAPAFYNRGGGFGGYIEESTARIQVTPRETEVFVDGYLAGVVDDFDGFAQRLRVAPGEHVIELYLDGHKTVTQPMMFAPGKGYRIQHTMEPVAAGDPAPVRPTPKEGAAAQPVRGPFDAFGQPNGRGPARSNAGTSAAIAIRVQPGDATVLVDGERWQTTGSDRLEIQVTPGEHRVEIQKEGYQSFTTNVRARSGETNAVNVSLTKSGDQ